MIKAEVITHEGNPGPNWLDHCKAMATPWTVTIVIIAVAVGITVFSLEKNRDVGQASQTPASQPADISAANSLKVAAAIDSSSPAEAKATSLQASATNGTPNTGTSPTTAATTLGATSTPALNTANSTNDSRNTTKSTANPDQITGANLTNKVQSTVQSAGSSLTQTVNGVRGGLGL